MIRPLTVLASLGVAASLVLASGCKVKDPPPITDTFVDDFERDSIGSDYYPTGGDYQIVDGVLVARKGYNHPLWLRKRLPRNVRIEIDVWAGTDQGDLKVEFFGDGRSHAKHKGAYKATGYVTNFGGWKNQKSQLARMDEHGKKVAVDKTRLRVVKDRKYHWTLVRQGKTVSWSIDGKPFLTYEDEQPLEGAGHRYFAFANWEAESRFDNLSITAL